MKKYPVLLFLIAFLFIFADCKKRQCEDEEELPPPIHKITATVEGVVPIGIDSVIATIPAPNESLSRIAKAPFKNSKFTIELPLTVNSQLLMPVSAVFPSTCTFSNPDAKTTLVSFLAKQGNDFKGSFIQSNKPLSLSSFKEPDLYIAFYIYSDKDVTITGTTKINIPDIPIPISVVFNCNFTKGWNYFVINSNLIIINISNSLPDGIKWYYTDFDFFESIFSFIGFDAVFGQS